MILHRDCTTISLEWIRTSVTTMISDPPYRGHVHKAATSQSPGRGARHRDLGFAYLNPRLRRAIGHMAAAVQRWSILYSDVEASTWLRLACTEAGAVYIRTMPWVRWSMPQLTGDRPPQGFEHLLVFWGHAPAGEKSWNGRGSLTHLDHLSLRGEGKHKAEKPLDQALDLVSWFSRPGDLVFDPFAGSGTICLAARMLGRHALGCELDEGWAASGNERLVQPLSERDNERVRRWLEDVRDDTAPQPGPSAERRARRVNDKNALRAAMGIR